MMYLVTKADGKRYPFDFTTMKARDAELLEDATGYTFVEFGHKLAAGSMKCLRALYWLLVRRDHPGLKLADVDFGLDEIKVENDEVDEAAPKAQSEDSATATG